MTPTPSTGKTIAPPVSRVDKAPETATKLLTRIAVSVERTEANSRKTLDWMRGFCMLLVFSAVVWFIGSAVSQGQREAAEYTKRVTREYQEYRDSLRGLNLSTKAPRP